MQIKTKIVPSHTADYKPVKQEVNGTVILPPLVFPGPVLLNKLLSKISLQNGIILQRRVNFQNTIAIKILF
jgi:hypothetical protein